MFAVTDTQRFVRAQLETISGDGLDVRNARMVCTALLGMLCADRAVNATLAATHDPHRFLTAEEQATSNPEGVHLVRLVRALRQEHWLETIERVGPLGFYGIEAFMAYMAAVETWLGVNGVYRRAGGLTTAGDTELHLPPGRPGPFDWFGVLDFEEASTKALDAAMLVMNDSYATLCAQYPQHQDLSACHIRDIPRSSEENWRRRCTGGLVALAGMEYPPVALVDALCAQDDLAVLDAFDACRSADPGSHARAMSDHFCLSMAAAFAGVGPVASPPGVLDMQAAACLLAAFEFHGGLCGPYRLAVDVCGGEDDTFPTTAWERLAAPVARPPQHERRHCRGS